VIHNAIVFHSCRFYIHCDGALFGMMMPFIKQAPMVTFKKPIGSVSVSGHKFVGAPVPCGVTITRMRYVMALSSDVEYLNSRDATIMGSRNGHAPIYLWYTLTLKGYEGIRQDVERCMRNAHILKVCLGRMRFTKGCHRCVRHPHYHRACLCGQCVCGVFCKWPKKRYYWCISLHCNYSSAGRLHAAACVYGKAERTLCWAQAPCAWHV
jgi:hypothetical protein